MLLFYEEEAKKFAEYPCDVIVISGQSNAEGLGRGGTVANDLANTFVVRPVFTREVSPETKRTETIYSGDAIVTVNPERTREDVYLGNLAAGFAPLYEKNDLAAGRKLLIVNAAVGGTGFYIRDNEWGVGRPLYENMIKLTDFALSCNKGNRLMGLLWHQGENEAVSGLPLDKMYEGHVSRLGAMLADYRARYGDMPIVSGGFTPAWTERNKETCRAVCDAMIEVSRRLGNAAFVESDGIPDNGAALGNEDIIHFSREGCVAFGERYYDAFAKLSKAAAK